MEIKFNSYEEVLQLVEKMNSDDEVKIKIISYEKRLYTDKEIKYRLLQLVSKLGLYYFNRRKIKFGTDEHGVSLYIKFCLPFNCVKRLMDLHDTYGLISGYEDKTGFEVFYHRDWKDDSPLFKDD